MLRTKCLLVAFVFWLCHHGFSVVCNSPGDNEGRYLVYNPNGGVFKLIVGWAIPVEVPMSVIWGHNFQFQYKPVDNASQLAYPVLARPKLSRNTVYTVLGETLNMYGLDGPSCVLRTLCEASRYEISHDSIYGHILDTILTPALSSNDSYYQAWSRGVQGDDCDSIYPSCELNLLELISTYV